jgi:hypothetical protein
MSLFEAGALLILSATFGFVTRPRWTATWAGWVGMPILIVIAWLLVGGGIQPQSTGPGLVVLLVVLGIATYMIAADPEVRRSWWSRRNPTFRFDNEVHTGLMEWREMGTVESLADPRVATEAGRRLVERLRALKAPDHAWAAVRDEYIRLIDERCTLIDAGVRTSQLEANGAAWQALFERVQTMRTRPRSQ